MNEQFKAAFQETLKQDLSHIDDDKIAAARNELDAAACVLQARIEQLAIGNPVRGLSVEARLRRNLNTKDGWLVELLAGGICVRSLAGRWVGALVELGEVRRICKDLVAMSAEDIAQEHQARKAALEDRKMRMRGWVEFKRSTTQHRLEQGCSVVRTGHFGVACKLTDDERAEADAALAQAAETLASTLAQEDDAALAHATVEVHAVEHTARPLRQVFVGDWPIAAVSHEFVLKTLGRGGTAALVNVLAADVEHSKVKNALSRACENGKQ